MTHVAVIGSGKMGRDIGCFLMGKGAAVSWVSASDERLETVRRHASKTRRRQMRVSPEMQYTPPAFYRTDTDMLPHDIDVVIETVEEVLERKRATLARATRLLPPHTLLCSNSSSMMPDAIYERCVGMHFFYPVQLHPLVEVILPSGCAPALRSRALGFANNHGLHPVVEDSRSAFSANRLLLPLQAEAVRLLTCGIPATVVDECSSAGLLPCGQLSLMDSVGLDVIAPAVETYVSRMPPEYRRDYAMLSAALARLLAMGKRGYKNDDGFLRGAPLPWPSNGTPTEEVRQTFRALFITTCSRFESECGLGRDDIDALMRQALDCDATLSELAETGEANWAARYVAKLYERTALSYFRP